MSRYVVYVNRPNNKAFIHLASCGWYVGREDRDASGYWSKEFETLKEAEDFAKSTQKRNIRKCLKCF
jgi:hypothetical protein